MDRYSGHGLVFPEKIRKGQVFQKKRAFSDTGWNSSPFGLAGIYISGNFWSSSLAMEHPLFRRGQVDSADCSLAPGFKGPSDFQFS